MQKKKLIVICGPTATGKTELAVKLCKLLEGEVISADSMQIYDEMKIGTARPDVAEMEGIRHHLMGFLPPDQNFSVADYVERARLEIEEITSRGKQPVLVGGTGLYISSLCNGVNFGAFKGDGAIRDQLRAEAMEKGGGILLERLKEIDPPAAAKLHENDIFRLTRAIEIYLTTGVTKTEWERRSREEEPPYDLKMIGLTFREREQLYQRINLRVDRMIQRGLIEEARALYNRGLKDTQAMQAIGYKELVEAFEGDCSLETAVEAIKQNSRRYAKRQLTWFRRDKRIEFLEIDGMTGAEILEAARGYIDQKERRQSI